MGKVYFSDIKASKETGVWGENPLNEDLNEEISINNRELVITIERISNDELRQEVKDFRGHVSSGVLSTSMKESENRLHEAGNLFMKLMEKVGDELRKNY